MDTKARTRSKKKKSRNKSAKSKQAPAPQKTCDTCDMKNPIANVLCSKCGKPFLGEGKHAKQNKSLLEDLGDAKDRVKILEEEKLEFKKEISELKSKGAVAVYRKNRTFFFKIVTAPFYTLCFVKFYLPLSILNRNRNFC